MVDKTELGHAPRVSPLRRPLPRKGSPLTRVVKLTVDGAWTMFFLDLKPYR